MNQGSTLAYGRRITKLMIASSLVFSAIAVVLPTNIQSAETAPVKLAEGKQAAERAKELNLLPQEAIVSSINKRSGEVWKIDYEMQNRLGEIWLSSLTGDVIQFSEHNFDVSNESKGKVTLDEAVKIGAEFIKEQPWEIENTWIHNSYPLSEYHNREEPNWIRFDRAYNGIRFEGNYFYLLVDSMTGQVTNYKVFWNKQTFEAADSIMSYQAAAMNFYNEQTPFLHWNENSQPKKLTYSMHDYYFINEAGEFSSDYNRETPPFTDKIKPQYESELAKLRLLSNYELELVYKPDGKTNKPYYMLRIKPGVPLFYYGDQPSIDANTGEWLDFVNKPVDHPFPPASDWLIDAVVPSGSIRYKAAIVWNNELLKLDNEPLVQNGFTLVPFRELLEKMGADISWDPKARVVTANKDGTTIKLPIDSNTIYVNGKALSTTPARITGGRTYIPARLVLETFGARVGWNTDSRLVLVATEDGLPDLTKAGIKQLRFQAQLNWLEAKLK